MLEIPSISNSRSEKPSISKFLILFQKYVTIVFHRPSYIDNSSCINLSCYTKYWSHGSIIIQGDLPSFWRFTIYEPFQKILRSLCFLKLKSYLIIFLSYYISQNLWNLLSAFLKKGNCLYNLSSQSENETQEHTHKMIFRQRFFVSFSIKLWKHNIIIWIKLFNFINWQILLWFSVTDREIPSNFKALSNKRTSFYFFQLFQHSILP